MLRIGVVGAGYWGPNLIRNFTQHPECEVTRVADLSVQRLEHIQGLFPHIQTTEDYRSLIAADDVDAICVCTPVRWHYPMAKEALLAGKHVLVEKPMTDSVESAQDLCSIAAERGLVLMVDHTFEYTVAVNEIRRMVNEGVLGNLYYVSMSRLNLGLLQKDINVVWDLAPHDISILNYVLGKTPTTVSAQGRANIVSDIEDVAMLTLEYEGGPMAYIQVSWLDPSKVRKATFVGSQKMLEYDDMESLEKIRIFDKGVDGPKHYDTFGDFQFSYRYGDIHTPYLESREPLQDECRHFVECVQDGTEVRSGGSDGLAVVKVLEAAQVSIKDGGSRQTIPS